MGCTLAAPGLPGGRLPSPPLGGFKGNCGFSGSSIFFVAALQTASAASLLAKSFQRLFGSELGAFTASLFFLSVAVFFSALNSRTRSNLPEPFFGLGNCAKCLHLQEFRCWKIKDNYNRKAVFSA
jgi:hypothetical protein